MRLPRLENRLKGKIIPPGFLLLISICGMAVIASLVILEYRARKQDLLAMLENQAGLFMNTLSGSAQNTLAAAEEFEKEINDRIIAGLRIMGKLDQRENLSDPAIRELLNTARLDELHLYGPSGKADRMASSQETACDPIPEQILYPKLGGPFDPAVFTLYDETGRREQRIVFMIPRENGGVIAGLVTKKRITALQSYFGFGHFLKRFQAEENVEYVVLQNSQTIIAGSFAGYDISSFSGDPLLRKVLSDTISWTRILRYGDKTVYEALAPFRLSEESTGVLRLGLSLREYRHLIRDVQKRFFILAATLFVIGLILINFTLSHRHRLLLRKDLKRLRDDTQVIFDNLQSGIIGIDQSGRVQTVNKQALDLIRKNFTSVYHQPCSVLPAPLPEIAGDCLRGSSATRSVRDIAFEVGGANRILAVRAGRLTDEEDHKNCVLLIDDVTEQRRYEEQVRLNDKLKALQEQASAMAHEIRNPLNAIKLLIDLIGKRIKQPSVDRELETVRKEITRISTIVEHHLRFGRPSEINMFPIRLPDLFNEITPLFQLRLKEKNIDLTVDLPDSSGLKGDGDQLKQVFINLIKNAEEGIGRQGEIHISGNRSESGYTIRIRDDGKGIAEKNIPSVFDLHFTTKKDGLGIGLPVVRQILSAHGGTIKVISEKGKGTEFVLMLPVEPV